MDTLPWPTPPPEFDIDPARCAVLLVDLQRMQIERGCGLAGRIEREFPEIAQYFFPRIENVVLPAVGRLVDAAHDAGIPVIALTIGPERPDGRDLAPWKRNRNRAMQAEEEETVYFFNGTEEHGLVPGIDLQKGDILLNKTTFNGFSTTALDHTLRNLGRDTLFVGGQAANVCVQATAFDAADRGYQTILVEEAVAAWDPELLKSTLRNFALMYGAVASVGEAVQLMTAGGHAAGRALPSRDIPPHVYAVDVEVEGCDVDEFNEWYETVHVPEVMACPGFLSARRWRITGGDPRFLAVYELEGPWVMETEELSRVRGWKQFAPFVSARTGVFAPLSQSGSA